MNRLFRSPAFVNIVIVVAAALPGIGVVTAFWTGDCRYLVLCFTLCLFL